MNKRTWCYALPPVAYDMACDKCGGTHITWSEFEGMIWCYDCQIDTPGFQGIFDGPIPWGLSQVLGMNFDRIDLATNKLLKGFINDMDEIEYLPEDEYLVRKAKNMLANKKENPLNDIIKSDMVEIIPATKEEKEEFRQQVLDWAGKRNGQE